MLHAVKILFLGNFVNAKITSPNGKTTRSRSQNVIPTRREGESERKIINLQKNIQILMLSG